MAQFYTLKVLSLLVYIFELISCREIDHSSPSLAIECNKDNPCPETQKCVIGECRETLSDFNPNCEYNCNVTDPICASNGKDFNSHCEMERENCLHGLEVYAECHEECPCEFDLSKSSQRCEFETTKEKVSAYFHQRSSKDFAELLLSADNLPKLFLSYVHQQCQYSAKWAFSVLDFDRSGFVEEKEIIDLYLTFNDPCVVEMVSQCDLNQNGMLSFVEWCYCFRDGQPTCDKARNAVPVTVKSDDTKPFQDRGVFSTQIRVGQFYPDAYVPMCNEDGYFLPTQSYKQKFWCVDEIGTEIVSSDAYNSGTDCNLELQMSQRGAEEVNDGPWNHF
ncbi:testican-3-like [Convolutriloba macropyga]|uniref:testican-3-like n=1 Tax=Convolutriloba macropyga TaxID=536237 RepID=UPI003F5219C9